MATVVDALVLTLGLDPSSFVKGQKEAQQSHKKFKESIVSESKEVEKSAIAASEGISKITKEVLGLLGVFTGGKAIKDFIADITKTDAAAGRFAKNFGVSASTLDAWGHVLQRNGGTAEDATASFQSMNDSLNEIAVTGTTGMLQFLYKLGGVSKTTIRTNAGVVVLFKDLATALHKVAETSPSLAHYYGMQITHNEAMTSLLMQGNGALQEQLDLVTKLGLENEKDAEAAKRRQTIFSDLAQSAIDLSRKMLTAVTPFFAHVIKGADRIAVALEESFAAIRDHWRETVKDMDGKFGDFAKHLYASGPNMLGAFKAAFADAFAWLEEKFNTIWEAVTGHKLFETAAPGGGAGAPAMGIPGGGGTGLRGALHGRGGGAGAQEGAAEPGTPWNRQTGGPPEALTKPHGTKMPPFEEFQKSLAGGSQSGGAADVGGNFFASIINAEGTGKKGDAYEEVLGYGAYGKPPKALTDMTLREVYDWGHNVLRPNSGVNSSAVGAFQIVGSTMKAYMGNAGLGWDDKFSPENQRKLATEIMKGQGTGAWEGFKSHPALRRLAEESFSKGAVDKEKTASVFDRMRKARGGSISAAEADRIRAAGVGARASGGPVDANSPYLVGEHGPELFIPAKSGKIKRDDELDDFIKSTTADHVARARMMFLRGEHTTKEHILGGGLLKSYLTWRNSIAEHAKAIKAARELQLWRRQGEANTGALRSGEFKPWPGASRHSDPGIIPRHTWQRHFLPDRSPDALQYYWLFGRNLQNASLGAGGNNSVTNNSASNQVHVANLNVHTAATDASGIVRDIKPAIERTSFAMHANYSLA